MRLPSRHLSFVFASTIAAALASGCGARLADCEALAAEEPACMTEAAREDCLDTNAECAELGAGEVLVLESCPLQFSCSQAP